MSKTVKRVASIALPVIGTIVAPGIGTALGSSLSGAALGAIGGAVGGAAGGVVSGGGLKGAALGAALGGAGGYLSSGGLGAVAGSTLDKVTGVAGAQGPTQGSGLLGAISRTGVGSAIVGPGPSVTQGLSSFLSPASLALTAGNVITGLNQADAAEEAARLQSQSVDRAIAAQQEGTAPYREFGEQAINQINEIQADPAAYIKNNELYSSLAADAERRLLANQAAKGKVGSGGTAAALQEQLLNIGNGLVQNQVNTLQGQVNTGANAATGNATNTANLLTQQGNAQAAGQVGSANAISNTYQNSINTLLALQSLNKTPTYQQINA